MLHYLAILAVVYIVALIVAPSQVIAATVLLVASVWGLVDWTTVPWIP
jgi:hypothetical protein